MPTISAGRKIDRALENSKIRVLTVILLFEKSKQCQARLVWDLFALG